MPSPSVGLVADYFVSVERLWTIVDHMGESSMLLSG